jgi:hypothetical protein
MAATGTSGPAMGWLPSDEAAGGRLFMPAAARNREPILQALHAALGGRVPAQALELASGSGEHAVAFAEAFPQTRWQPSDRDPAGLASIAAWREHCGLANLAPPLPIDLELPGWHGRLGQRFDLMVAINVVHIAPWRATLGLLDGAAALLSADGLLFVYGCFSRSGDFVSQSNVSFDAGLRRRNPAWGVRDTEDVAQAAAVRGLSLRQVMAMPANNTVLVLVRHPGAGGTVS